MKLLSSLVWAIAVLCFLAAIFANVLGQKTACYLYDIASLIFSFCSVRLRTGSWSLF